jgi:hypothetical protein
MGNPGASIETKAAKPFESESSSKSIKICNSQATLLYRLDLAQLTLHFPPCSCWLLAHRKCLCTMSKPLMNCLGGFKTVSIYTGREVRTDRTNTRLPPRFSNLHCQPANLATTLSLMFWRCTNRNRPSAMGMPCKTPDFHRKPESLYHRDSPWISGYRVQNVSQIDTQSHTSHHIKLIVH